MHPKSRRRLSSILALALVAVTLSGYKTAASGEYFTEEEIDYIRDAQGLAMRIPALLRLANIRLVSLSMKEKSKEDKDLEKRIAEIHDELVGKPQSKTTPRPGEKPGDSAKDVGRPYLTELSRTELLRGYIEALDEIRSVIDDAYRDKQDVRGVLEQFEKFLSTSNPLLRRFQSKGNDEFQAILDARSTTQEALDDAQDALKKVPKTEKSTRP
jgi:hypothetical protein